MTAFFPRNTHIENFLYSMCHTPKGVGPDDAAHVKLVVPSACDDMFKSVLMVVVGDVHAEVEEP